MKRGSRCRWPRWSSHPWARMAPTWSSPSRVRSSTATSPPPGAPRAWVASWTPWEGISRAIPPEPERHPSLDWHIGLGRHQARDQRALTSNFHTDGRFLRGGLLAEDDLRASDVSAGALVVRAIKAEPSRTRLRRNDS